jgi:dephospho-CoA kinase
LRKFKIAFTGWAGSGKTEAAKYISHKYDGNVISFADGIKYVDRYLFGIGTKNRDRLQRIGEFFRTIDSDIWVKRTLETAEFEDRVLIDDLRRMNEYEALKNNGFVIVRVVADESVRIDRLIKRDGTCDVSLLYNESESGCANLSVLEIKNNGSIEELHLKLDVLMEQYIL